MAFPPILTRVLLHENFAQLLQHLRRVLRFQVDVDVTVLQRETSPGRAVQTHVRICRIEDECHWLANRENNEMITWVD